MASLPPRLVVVTRETDYELLLARHATREAVRFFLHGRDQSLDAVEARHARVRDAVHAVRAALPRAWRQAAVRRSELDRFLFAPGDIVAAVGQDGLIANVAKYLNGQPVVGINPDPETIAGVLARVAPRDAAATIVAAAEGTAMVESRTMIEARLDTGETLAALNEIFVGHRSHQSAVYDLAHGDARERQSSSGLIAASGTGASGWARSIMEATGRRLPIDPFAPVAGYFVREAWPSPGTGTDQIAGLVTARAPLEIVARMEGGVVFADGIEQDYLRLDWGMRVTVRPSPRTLKLVVGAAPD